VRFAVSARNPGGLTRAAVAGQTVADWLTDQAARNIDSSACTFVTNCRRHQTLDVVLEEDPLHLGRWLAPAIPDAGEQADDTVPWERHRCRIWRQRHERSRLRDRRRLHGKQFDIAGQLGSEFGHARSPEKVVQLATPRSRWVVVMTSYGLYAEQRYLLICTSCNLPELLAFYYSVCVI
jgi:hypothetical protein